MLELHISLILPVMAPTIPLIAVAARPGSPLKKLTTALIMLLVVLTADSLVRLNQLTARLHMSLKNPAMRPGSCATQFVTSVTRLVIRLTAPCHIWVKNVAIRPGSWPIQLITPITKFGMVTV